MSSLAPAGYTTRELQAAAAALAAGRFATATSAGTGNQTSAGISAGISAAIATVVSARPFSAEAMSVVAVPGERWTGPSATDCPIPPPGSGPVVRIRAAHAGAGASTTALALADVADLADIRTRVVDAAAPAWSGLLGASVTELGAAEGWRRGRRGANVLLDRVAKPVLLPAQVPSPRVADGVFLTVLDAGWSMRELAAATDAWVALMRVQVDVLVTRPHDLALHQTEAALALLANQTGAQASADSVVVVVVGAKRRNARELPTAGPLLRAVRQRDGVLFAPLLPARALPGLGPDRMPKPLITSAQRLLDRITTMTGLVAANRT